MEQFSAYKFYVSGTDGKKLFKIDPYAYHFETRPDNASKYFDISGFHWNDAPWYAYKKAHPHEQSPVNIYEVHLAHGAGMRTGIFTLTESLRKSWFLMLRKWAIRISRSCR